MQPTAFDVPDQMRQAAEKGVQQARKAVEQFMEVTQQAVAKAEGSNKLVPETAVDVNLQALAFVEENLAAAFDLAQNLVRARTLEEVGALQQEFVRRQMTAVAEQEISLGEMINRATLSAPPKPRR
jgi:phasin